MRRGRAAAAGWRGGGRRGGARRRPRFCSAGGVGREATPLVFAAGVKRAGLAAASGVIGRRGENPEAPGAGGAGVRGGPPGARRSGVCLRPVGSRARAGQRRGPCPRQQSGAGTCRSPARSATGEVAVGRGLGAEQRPSGDERWCSAIAR